MRYSYILSIFGYPLVVWGIIYLLGGYNDVGVMILLLGVIFLLVKDVLICQSLGTSKEMGE